MVFVLCAALLFPAQGVFAQSTNVSVVGGIESKSEESITVTGPADIEITKKDGTIYRLHVEAGAAVSYSVKNDEKGTIKVDVKKIPSTGVLQTTGAIDPRTNTVGLTFLSPAREAFGVQSVTLPEDIQFTSDLKVDDWDAPRKATFTATQSTIKLPSFDILNGQAETGPITITIDPEDPVVGEIDLLTGEYTTSYGLILDMPNVRLSNGQPLKVKQAVQGLVDKAILAKVLGKQSGAGSFTTAGTIAAVVVVIVAALFAVRKMRKGTNAI